jgi:hypothetical protein
MLRIATVNKAIAAAGIELELVAGEGYFYFVGPGIDHAFNTSSVYTYRLNHQTIEAWLADAWRCADEIAEAA